MRADITINSRCCFYKAFYIIAVLFKKQTINSKTMYVLLKITLLTHLQRKAILPNYILCWILIVWIINYLGSYWEFLDDSFKSWVCLPSYVVYVARMKPNTANLATSCHLALVILKVNFPGKYSQIWRNIVNFAVLFTANCLTT